MFFRFALFSSKSNKTYPAPTPTTSIQQNWQEFTEEKAFLQCYAEDQSSVRTKVDKKTRREAWEMFQIDAVFPPTQRTHEERLKEAQTSQEFIEILPKIQLWVKECTTRRVGLVTGYNNNPAFWEENEEFHYLRLKHYHAIDPYTGAYFHVDHMSFHVLTCDEADEFEAELEVYQAKIRNAMIAERVTGIRSALNEDSFVGDEDALEISCLSDDHNEPEPMPQLRHDPVSSREILNVVTHRCGEMMAMAYSRPQAPVVVEEDVTEEEWN
jgi:hypothetical protein